MFDKHILPRVGGLALRDVTPAVVAGLSADMQAAGIGPAATRKALMVLQGIFSCAVNWGHVQSNPVVGVRKPSAKRQRAVSPPSPAVVERMRGELLAAGQVRDATLVSVLAYAGLRPQEALRRAALGRARRAARAWAVGPRARLPRALRPSRVVAPPRSASYAPPTAPAKTTTRRRYWQYLGSGYLNPSDVLLAAGVEASLRVAREALLDLRGGPP